MESAVRMNQQSVRRGRLITFRILTVFIGALIGLVVAETGLRLVEKNRLGDRGAPVTITDPLLGERLAPNTSGQDANGFRNESVRAQVDIVALGDSQTWGVNVQRVDAWPQQLEKLSGRSVYNMGVGGYGPVQYSVLTGKALSFSPKVIVVGLYFGNDFYDAYALAYSNDKYAELRSNQASDEMRIDTVKTRSQFYWDEEKNFHNNYGRSSPTGWSFWLREHSAIGRLLNRTGLWPGATDVDYEIDKAWARAYPDHGAVCEHADIRTVFTTAYRLTGLDLDDPRIAEGLCIVGLVLWRAQQTADGRGAKFMVLLIPTKELVYAELMQREGKLTDTYSRLVEMENRARRDVESWCNEKRIRCVDALPYLQRAIAGRQQVYPSTTESHPNAAGYRVLAATVNEALKN
jgi:lysophospholipase L1-like esterase